MSETADSAPAPRRSRLPLLLALLAAVAAGAGGFYAAWSRLLPLPERAEAASAPASARGEPSFVALDPITINLGSGSERRHLRFTAQLEVRPAHRREIEAMKPRLIDILNTYLRALDPPELEAAGVIHRLRAQLLRRMRMVAGPDRIDDLLIIEFVFN